MDQKLKPLIYQQPDAVEQRKSYRRAAAKLYRKRHPEKVAERSRLYRAQNTEKVQARQRKWSAENAAYVKQQRHEYYTTNRDKIAAANKEYRSSHPEAVKARLLSYKQRRPEVGMWSVAKRSAARRGLEFSIEVQDIVIPALCPIFGCSLTLGVGNGRAPTNASLDRIDSEKGYVKGNIQVISWRANTMKSDASIAELVLFAHGILKRYGAEHE